MAGESVLIVDDAPVNLKLTDILLRKEGYQVQTASDAEEALKVLGNFRPDLMLVDIQMPGIDGLELTRRVKRDPATKDIVVVALTACAMKEDEQNAMAAGCSGYITKPIDTHTLGKRVRHHLDGRLAVEAPLSRPAALLQAVPDAELESLRQRFIDEGTLQVRQLLESLNTIVDPTKPAQLLHRWIGSAGVLGYTAIAELARKTETALSNGKLTTGEFRSCLLELSAAFAKPQATADPKPILVDALSGKSIALVGFAAETGDRLCGALERAGARPRVFDTTVEAGARPVLDCHAMVYQVQADSTSAPILATAGDQARMPIILAGKRDQILSMDLAVLARTNDFLIDGWKPDEAVMRLSFSLLRAVTPIQFRQTAPRRLGQRDEVLLADDDPAILSQVRTALQDFGMQCTVLLDGATALERIRQDLPRVAVLDVNMPGLDGYLVLAAIREEKLPVRVILLTSRKHENDISRAFTLGADDYVVKPFNRIELVARVKRLLKN